jgi:hypothetical protein
VGIACFPTLTTVAEPCSIAGVKHPKDTLLILEHELGYFEAKLLLAYFTSIAQAFKISEATFGLLVIHQVVPNG